MKIITKKIMAFTLAELALCLSVIGAIAAITIPAVRSMAPNREMILFKKAFGEFSRVTNELVNDDELYPEPIGGGANYLGNTDSVTYRGNDADADGNAYTGAAKFCALFAARMNVIGDVNCASDDVYNFTTADGISWNLPVSDFSDAEAVYPVTIDVNGTNKAPNSEAAEESKQDRFTFNIRQDGSITYDQNSIIDLYLQETDMSKTKSEIRAELEVEEE